MSERPEKRGGLGFWSGFRFGLGFVTALMLAATLTGGLVVGAAWWAFGSVQGLVTAGARTAGDAAGTYAREVASGAGAGLADARDRAVAGAAAAARQAGDAARRTGQAVTEGGAAVGSRASDAKAAVAERVTGWAARVRGAPDPAPPPAPEGSAAGPVRPDPGGPAP